jgi:hypothetical protein
MLSGLSVSVRKTSPESTSLFQQLARTLTKRQVYNQFLMIVPLRNFK